MTMLLPLPCVCQMMPPLLCSGTFLRGLDAEILVRARQLLYAAVEEHEVVHQFDEPPLAAHLEQILVQLEARCCPPRLPSTSGNTSPACRSCRIADLRSRFPRK